MIDIWQANIQTILAVGVTLIVLLLAYIAFFKDSGQKHGADKRK